MIYVYTYLIFGWGFWLGVSCARFETFKGASPGEVVRGFLMAVLCWPIALYFLPVALHENSRDVE